MPQASEALRAEWMDGDPSDYKATQYLRSAGYTLSRSWKWRLPNPRHKPTEKELSAVQFLIDEWDYDGIVQPKKW